MTSDHDAPTRANLAVSGHNFRLEDVTVSNLFDAGTKKAKPKPKVAESPAQTTQRFTTEQAPWECGGRGCPKKGRWWRSIHGVINCLDCRPPTFPQLAAAIGGPENTPVVTREIACHDPWVEDPETYLGNA